eukprot:360804-Chlamydomonas_euryale.AAC.6
MHAVATGCGCGPGSAKLRFGMFCLSVCGCIDGGEYCRCFAPGPVAESCAAYFQNMYTRSSQAQVCMDVHACMNCPASMHACIRAMPIAVPPDV